MIRKLIKTIDSHVMNSYINTMFYQFIPVQKMGKKKGTKLTDVSASYGKKPTYTDQQGNLWNDQNQRVVYTDYSGNGRTGIVWGTHQHQSQARSVQVSWLIKLKGVAQPYLFLWELF